jgi:hypothetical protein
MRKKTYHNYQRRLYHSTHFHKFTFRLLRRIKFYFYSSIYSTWFHQSWSTPKTIIRPPPPPLTRKLVTYELFLLGYLVLRLGPWQKLGPLMDEGNFWGYEEERGVYPPAIKDFPHTTSNTRALGHSVKDWHRRSSEATTAILGKKRQSIIN